MLPEAAMSLRTLALAGAFAALAPVLAGCAEDDVDREAAYPQPIGYTAPRPGPPAVQVAQSTTPPMQQPGVQGEAVEVDPTTQEEGGDYADTDPSALTDFRSTLDPYGSWVDDPTYGTAWVPSESVVGSDFSPYVSAGHWDYDDDYTWVSDYDWGWAPFHYGRWAYAAPYGWEWIPGRVYAGAWVSWRYGWGDWGYVGWAPLGPTWGWRGGVAVGLGYVPVAPYGFCATGDLFAGRVAPHMVAGGQVGTIAAHTQPYTPANPGVSGHVGATPRVNGPAPQLLHIPDSAVAHGANTNRGVQQAQAFAHPATATAMGARAPQGYASRAPTAGFASRPQALGRMPSYGPPAPSHFGGKLGSGFRGDIASSRPAWGGSYGYSGVRPGAYGSYAPYRGGGGWSGAGVGWGGGFHGGSPGVVSSAPGRRGGGSSGGEGYSGVPHGFSGGGGFHGGSGFGSGGFSGSSGGFHGGGGGFSGGGGFHGGGGGRGGGGRR
jgi:hypothetical protein